MAQILVWIRSSPECLQFSLRLLRKLRSNTSPSNREDNDGFRFKRRGSPRSADPLHEVVQSVKCFPNNQGPAPANALSGRKDGVGKSQIVAQVASDLGWQFLDIRAVQLDPVDLRGLPRISADQAEWVPPKFLPTSGSGILFLDELTAAPQITQAGCYQLVLDRKLGEYSLPGASVASKGN
jgi:hypothetical protein